MQSGSRWKGFNADPKFRKKKNSNIQDGAWYLHAHAQLCTFTTLKEKLSDWLVLIYLISVRGRTTTFLATAGCATATLFIVRRREARAYNRPQG